ISTQPNINRYPDVLSNINYCPYNTSIVFESDISYKKSKTPKLIKKASTVLDEAIIPTTNIDSIPPCPIPEAIPSFQLRNFFNKNRNPIKRPISSNTPSATDE